MRAGAAVKAIRRPRNDTPSCRRRAARWARPPALHTDEGRAERRREPSRDVDAKRGPGLAARTPRGVNYLAEAHFGGFGTRPFTCADSLPEQSTAYVSKSPL